MLKTGLLILVLSFGLMAATPPELLTASAPLSYSSGVLSIPLADTDNDGYLSSTDWDTFNSKQASGNYITALTGDVTASGPGSASATISASTVTGKALTGFSASAGTVSASDTILQAFNKIYGWVTALWVEEISGHIRDAEDYTYVLVQKARYARQVDKIALKCSSGTITAALQIDSTDITTCTSISVTSAESDTTCDTGSSNDPASEETLTLVTTSNSSCGDLYFTIQTTRS